MLEGGRLGSVDRWALLIHVHELPTMDEMVCHLREQAPSVRIDYVGPMPAFTFLDEITLADAPSSSRWGW